MSGFTTDDDAADDSNTAIACYRKVIDPDGETAYCFQMTRRELDDGTKCKHYYVYSTASDVGKSTFMRKMEKILNCTVITDFSNWVGMKAHAQFILSDEVSHDRCMRLADLKTLTGGDASHFAGNRKFYGASFVPRPDAQVIFFSSHHLFEVYGRWSSKHERRLINPSVAASLRARFNIIKLDESDGATEADDAAFFTRRSCKRRQQDQQQQQEGPACKITRVC